MYYFAPSLFDSLPLNIPPAPTIRLDTKIKGKDKDLNIEHFTLGLLTETSLSTRGNLQIRKDKDPYFDLAIEKFYTTRRDIQSILVDSLIPNSIALPDWLNIKAQGKGTFDSPSAKAVITSNLGLIELDAALKKMQLPEAVSIQEL